MGRHRRKKWLRGRCYDCGEIAPWYMVRNGVWLQAWPDYRKCKSLMVSKHGPGLESCLELCFGCLAKRLGRPLRAGDFDLSLPVNLGIELGLLMAGWRGQR